MSDPLTYMDQQAIGTRYFLLPAWVDALAGAGLLPVLNPKTLRASLDAGFQAFIASLDNTSDTLDGASTPSSTLTDAVNQVGSAASQAINAFDALAAFLDSTLTPTGALTPDRIGQTQTSANTGDADSQAALVALEPTAVIPAGWRQKAFDAAVVALLFQNGGVGAHGAYGDFRTWAGSGPMAYPGGIPAAQAATMNDVLSWIINNR